jgi:drug/metabolite transporter (DMT)-like permease
MNYGKITAMKKGHGKAYIALGLVSFLWGTTYIASKVGASHMPGLFVSGVRQFASGILMVGFFMLKGYNLPDWSTLKKVSVQGIFLLCISNGLFTWALEYISSGLAAIIAGLVPLFVALFSIWLLKFGRFTKWMIAGLLIGLGGIVTIFYEYLHQLVKPEFAFGVILSLVAALSWSFGTVYSSRNKLPLDILYNVGLQMLIAGMITLIVCFVTGKYANLANTGEASLYALVYLVVFGSLIAYSSYVFAISKLPPTMVSVYAYINPLVAIVLGWLLLHEKMSINVILGTLITLAGVFLVNREFKKQAAWK